MKRHQQILLGVLALQVILSVIVFWPRQAKSGTGELLFPDVAATDVVALTITDNLGEQVALRKADGMWVLPDAGDYPAKGETITPVIESLVTLDTATLVARSEANHKQLQVSEDTFQRRLDFETAAGKTYTVYLGSAPRYTATHFRVGGKSETYLTTALSTYELYTRASSWIDTVYIAIDQETVTGAVLENAQGTFSLVKSGEDWTLADLAADETISTGSTGAIVRNASTLSLMTPLGKTEDPSYGLDSPSAVVTLQTDDGATHVLTVGSKSAEDNTYVVKSSDSPYYVRVSEYLVSGHGRERAGQLPDPAAHADPGGGGHGNPHTRTLIGDMKTPPPVLAGAFCLPGIGKAFRRPRHSDAQGVPTPRRSDAQGVPTPKAFRRPTSTWAVLASSPAPCGHRPKPFRGVWPGRSPSHPPT